MMLLTALGLTSLFFTNAFGGALKETNYGPPQYYPSHNKVASQQTYETYQTKKPHKDVYPKETKGHMHYIEDVDKTVYNKKAYKKKEKKLLKIVPLRNKKQQNTKPIHSHKRKYMGNCKNKKDGFYYNDKHSFVMCTNGISHIQYCAHGSINSGTRHYIENKRYLPIDFCDINLVDVAYAPEMSYAHYPYYYNSEMYASYPHPFQYYYDFPPYI